MPFALHPELDADALSATFRTKGWVSIAPFLPEEQAEALREHLLGRTDWYLRLRDLDGRLFDLSPDEQREWGAQKTDAIRQLIQPRVGQKGFGYAHVRLRIVETEGRRREPTSLLGEFGEFLASAPVLDLVQQISGEPEINFADSFAARYDPGDYTTEHDDGIDERKLAYVFGLTSRWRPDWGGLLLFHADDGEIEHGLVPGFNVLNLFAVPRAHSVSAVAPFAKEPRLSVSGWFHALKAVTYQPSADGEPVATDH